MPVYSIKNDSEIVGYANLDFAGSPYDKKYTSCYLLKIVGGALSWKCVKQTIIVFPIM